VKAITCCGGNQSSPQSNWNLKKYIPAGPNLSPFTLETSNALLSPLGSHFRWLYTSTTVSSVDISIDTKTQLESVQENQLVHKALSRRIEQLKDSYLIGSSKMRLLVMERDEGKREVNGGDLCEERCGELKGR
jgi:hypothetical protein